MQARRVEPKRVRGLDRLPALIALVALVACSEPGPPAASAPPPGRVAAVMATPAPEVSVQDFCEVLPDEGSAPTFSWPELDGEAPPPGAGWTWVNVWATWCAPCIEEMPRLQAFEKKLQEELGPGQVRFLSADSSARDIEVFRKRRPSTPDSVRVKELAVLTPWLKDLGLGADPVLPVHLFVDASQKTRCIRTGAVSEEDYAAVKRLLGRG